MNKNKRWSILFIKDEMSAFDANTQAFDTLFSRVDKVSGRESALKAFDQNAYDIVIVDLTVKPEELAFMKQLSDIKEGQCLFALVAPKDTDKLYGIADMGIHAFELEPNQFDQALETIADFNPYAAG